MSQVITKAVRRSFAALQEALGLGGPNTAVKRKIRLEQNALKQLREKVKSNVVLTSKYNCFTFLPINLFQQMSKAANVYFALITLMQTIKVISISNGEPTMLPPLVLVVVTSMIKDAYEDYCRHSEDAIENNALANRFNHQKHSFEKVRWGDIQVGDYVKVDQDEFFPADMVVIKSTEDEGVCYVETKNLDGETNLKNKVVPRRLWNAFQDEGHAIRKFDATLSIEGPNNLIYKFDGTMEFDHLVFEDQYDASRDSQVEMIPLSNENILLRGMSLRNVESILGVVVYTGHETKIQMNSSKSIYKVSKMMEMTNEAIFYIFLLQCLFSFAGAFICAKWTMENEDNSYLVFGAGSENVIKSDVTYLVLTMTGSWILIFCNFVPISLLVTLEMVKFFQGSFMDCDLEMYDADQDFYCRAQSTNINEELGQVEYIFSDKTGTLTCNIMEFNKFSSTTVSIDVTAKEKIEQSQEIDFISNPHGLIFKGEPELKEILDYYSTDSDKQGLYDVLMHLAVCHTVVIDKNKGVYNAASPDELALVDGAKAQGFEFMGRETDNVLVVKDPAGTTQRFKVLNVLEFNSTRKRMSLIVQNMQTGYIELYSKGADSIMEKLLAKGGAAEAKKLETTKNYIDAYSREGLRTLMLTKKDVSQREYDSWNLKWEQANLQTENRDDAIDEISAQIETDMTLLGSTAIEDKLQEDVERTIVSLKAAGIKLWVLTGDKIETAIQIGYSTGLLNDETSLHKVDAPSFGELSHQLATVADEVNRSRQGQRNALVLSGESLTAITMHCSSGLLELLLEMADKMEVVVGCRVSPKQKGDIVALMRIRHPGKVTLAIGDGANDCNMIMKAHVGIGIAGREGMQAARSADFAIGKFKFLHRLLFLHGREAYRRNGELILFMFYKNILYVIVQFMFGYYSIFSGQTMYEKWIYQIYNVSFTGLHNIWYALFDFQFEHEVFMTTPILYTIGMNNVIFNMKEFWIWFLYACAQAFAILMLCFVASQESPAEDGKTFNFWAGGHHIYMNCVLLANLLILKMQHNFTGVNLFIILLQIFQFFLFLWYFNEELQTDVIYLFWDEFISSKVAWLGAFFVVSSLWTIDNMLHSMRLALRSWTEGGFSEEEDVLEIEIKRLESRSGTMAIRPSEQMIYTGSIAQQQQQQ